MYFDEMVHGVHNREMSSHQRCCKRQGPLYIKTSDDWRRARMSKLYFQCTNLYFTSETIQETLRTDSLIMEAVN